MKKSFLIIVRHILKSSVYQGTKIQCYMTHPVKAGCRFTTIKITQKILNPVTIS